MAVRTEDNFMAEYEGLPDDLEVYLGVTVAQGREMLRRRPDPAGTVFMPSIAYSAAAGDEGQMAVYARADSSQRAPMVLFVHGGGWSSGHHFGEIRYVHPLAALGYVAATVTYRLADEAPWPAAIEDVKCAVRWLRQHAADLGGDPERIVVCGGSAGAHLAALVALTPGEYEGTGGWQDVPSAAQGAVLFSPAVDLAAIAGHVPVTKGYFGDDLVDASPINRVTSACPPVLTLTGDADDVTPLEAIQRFHSALDAAGVAQRLQVFDGRIHGFDLVPDDFRRCQSEVVDFLAATVGAPAGPTADRSVGAS